MRIKVYYIFATIFTFIIGTIYVQYRGIRVLNLHCPPELEVRLRGPISPDDKDFLSFLSKVVLIPPSKYSYNWDVQQEYDLSKMSRFDYIVKKNKLGHSWPAITAELKHLFPIGSKHDGFFVEAGAYDGEYMSNSFYLEVELGWKGLLVEPTSKNFQKLLNKNRKAWSCNCCLAPKNYPYKTNLVNVDHFFMNDVRNSIVGSKHARDVASAFTFSSSYETVQCYPLQSLLTAINRTRVDVISLDVEGSEMGVLKYFPFANILVDIWIVEHMHTLSNGVIYEDRADPDFIKWFEKKGYIFYKMLKEGPRDYMFIRKNSTYFSSNKQRLQLNNL